MKKAFTLIELLLTITIFSIVVTAFLGLFSSAFTAQQRSLATAYLLNNASYISEYLSRALRMAKKDLTGACISPKDNFALINQSHLKFLNQTGECQEFLLNVDNQIEVRRNGLGLPLTPANLIVENLKFEISGQSQTDNFQPKVTFTLRLASGEQLFPALDFQTTVSQRDLDVQY